MQKSNKVLITGATGLLGTHLLLNRPKGVKVFGTIHEYRKVLDLPEVSYVDLDIRDKKQVAKVISSIMPDVVIHTAAHTSVDFCEKNKEDTRKTNIEGTRYICEAISNFGGKILFCSTNMTYDGLNAPYNEESKQNPLSFYGKSKVEGEKIIESTGIDYTIIRLMTMYGWNFQPKRRNMVSMLVEKLSNGEKLWMTNDVWNNMLYVNEAAKFFWAAVLNPEKTTKEKFNIAGADRVNRYQVTMTACEVFGLDKSLVTEVTSDFFKGQEVPRAPDTTFDTTKAQKRLGFNPLPLRRGLEHMKKHRLTGSTKKV